MLIATSNKIDNPQPVVTEGSGKALIGGEFTLTNQDGSLVTPQDYKGKVMLVFFGFTSCPDICPTGVATYASVLRSLGEKADQIAPIFITVDPEVDTAAVLKAYLANVDSRIIGLTGTHEQIEKAASVYKAYFSKNTTSEGQGMVDHSGFIYLMDKNGEYVKHFPYDAPAAEVTAAVTDVLNKE